MNLMPRLLASAALAAGLALPAMAQDDPFQVGFIYVGSPGDYGLDLRARPGASRRGRAFRRRGRDRLPRERAGRRGCRALDHADDPRRRRHGLHHLVRFRRGDERRRGAVPPMSISNTATGYQRDYPNVSTYNARFYEGRAVLGHIAGHMTESNIIGYIGSYPIPEVIQGITLPSCMPARSTPPTSRCGWSGATLVRSGGRGRRRAGADRRGRGRCSMQHTDSTAPQTVAQEAGIISFGQASDMIQFAPRAPARRLDHRQLGTLLHPPASARRWTAPWEQSDIWEGIDTAWL